MEECMRPISVDATQVFLMSEREIDSAIDTVVTFAFGNAEPLDRYLFRIRAALPPRPSVKALVDAVFQVRAEVGPISDEAERRDRAAMAMAAFLSDDPSEMGMPAAMFRVGQEVWLTPSRRAQS
jgi:hypothetical protein